MGAATTTISSYGVEKYEGAAYDIAEQVLASAALRSRWVDCDGTTIDEACATDTLDTLGRHLWRRPLSDAELMTVTDIALHAADTLGDFDAGLAYGMATLLMSPHFLYRVELGDGPDAPTGGYDDWEMASRLSFFLWDTTPDAELLDDAEAGRLTDETELQAVVDRMLADPRTREGVSSLFSEMLHLDELDSLTKDPTVFTYMSDDLGPSARTETLSVIERHIFDDEAPYPVLFTTRRTIIDRTLAALYDVPAPSPDGFAELELPVESGRRGILGHASFLALQATRLALRSPGGASSYARCCSHHHSRAAANASTAILKSTKTPAPCATASRYTSNPACAGCHRSPTPSGSLRLRRLGRWRTPKTTLGSTRRQPDNVALPMPGSSVRRWPTIPARAVPDRDLDAVRHGLGGRRPRRRPARLARRRLCQRRPSRAVAAA